MTDQELIDSIDALIAAVDADLSQPVNRTRHDHLTDVRTHLLAARAILVEMVGGQ